MLFSRHDDANLSRSLLRESWGWLVVSVASRAYLSLLLSLVAVSTLPLLLGWQASVVQSSSMAPHIQPGDVAVTMPLPADRAVPLGRVVSFSSPADASADGRESLRLHRIVTANDDGTFVTKGDANLDVDSSTIDREAIVGQARLLVPSIGLPSLWFGAGNFTAIAIWGFATLLAVLIAALDFPNAPALRPRTTTPLIAQES